MGTEPALLLTQPVFGPSLLPTELLHSPVKYNILTAEQTFELSSGTSIKRK